MLIEKYSNRVLVTGSHRSGSTWLGHMMSIPKDVDYIHEPFNPGLPQNKEYSFPFGNTFEYFPTADGKNTEVDKYFDELLQGQLRKSKGSESSTIIIKDPIAFMSAEWWAKNYDTKNIVLIRHPAAFVASLKIKNWSFDFNNYRDQTKLLNEVLFPFKDEIISFADNPRGIIDQGILLWNIFYYRTKIYELYNKEWKYVRHEDLSMRPFQEIHKLYEFCGLEWNDEINQKIEENVNPEKVEEFKRNAKENVYSWMERLTPEEIAKIRKGTANIASLYYSDEDWRKEDAPPVVLSENQKFINQANKLPGRTRFHLDSINGEPVGENLSYNITHETLELNGWALDDLNNKKVGKIIARIGQQYFEADIGGARKDVANHFKLDISKEPELANCGFGICADTLKFSKGPKEFELFIFADNQKDYFQIKTPYKLNIT